VGVVFFCLSAWYQNSYENSFLPKNVQSKLQYQVNDFINQSNHLFGSKELIYAATKQLNVEDSFLNKNFGWAICSSTNNKPIFWNNDFNINNQVLKNDTLIKDTSSYSYVRKVNISNNLVGYAIYPIKYINGFNNNRFNGFEELSNFYDLTFIPNYNYAILIKNQPIFYLEKIATNFFNKYTNTALLFRILSVLILVFFVNYHARTYAKKIGFTKGFMLLLLFIGAFRAITYFFKFPFWFQKIYLFDASVYASNSFHRSLGDLLVNTLLLFWVVSILETRKSIANFSIISNNKLIQAIPLVCIPIVTFTFIDIVESLILDSKIPFEVSSFFSLNIFTVIAFVTICLLVVNYTKIVSILYRLGSKSKFSFFTKQLILAISGAIILGVFWFNFKDNMLFFIAIISWLLLYFYTVNLIEHKKVFKNFGADVLSLFYILFFTASTAGLTVYFERELDIEQRKDLAEKVYLEYTNEEHFSLTHFKHHNLPYAIYQNGSLVQQVGNYYFSNKEEIPTVTYILKESFSNSKLLYSADKKTVVAIYKKENLLLNFITLFAYLFFTFLIVNSILYLLVRIGNYNKQQLSLKFFSITSIRLQIKATVISLSVIIFITLAITSIFFFTKKFEESNEESINNSLGIVKNIENDYLKNDSAWKANIEEFAKKSNYNFLVYDETGQLKFKHLTTSNNPILNNHFIFYKAYRAIYANREDYAKVTISNATNQFNYYYKALKNNKGKFLGCICIPDIDYSIALKKELSGFIATLININAFIFLLAGALAFFITIRITSSFSLIKNKMKAINWRSSNEKIEWNRDDEIGALVDEYNVLVKKLEANASDFAQSQKEVAWKEMAKQVAHEIKNPLTPMKLSIQYLQSKIDEDAPNVKQLTKTVASTLIEQINQLSNIAGDFSQFANITNVKAEIFDLNEIINNVVNLHSTNMDISINTNLTKANTMVFADKTQIQRLFTNLIKNAIEATPENTTTKIGIYQSLSNNNVITAIQDNGTGIAESLHSKIFSVNFTTKSSGTGLGLAICKAIVDNINGSIWFSTTPSGTTFFVEIPLHSI
jgi:signal transduction histidine kinase